MSTGSAEISASSSAPCSSLLLDPSRSAARDLLAEDAARRTLIIYHDIWKPLEQPAIVQVLLPPPPLRFIHVLFIASGMREKMMVALPTCVRINFGVREAFTRKEAAPLVPCPAPLRWCRDASCKCRALSRCVIMIDPHGACGDTRVDQWRY